MKFPNEIDEQLIRLGHSVDSAFQQALADSFDVLGNLDRDPSLNADGVRDVLNSPTPWLPVRMPKADQSPHISSTSGVTISLSFYGLGRTQIRTTAGILTRTGIFSRGH